MPSVTRYLDVPSGLTSIPGQTSLLQDKIVSRKRLFPADLDAIRALYNTWRAHTHTYYDQTYIAYGNTPPQSTSGTNRTSFAVSDAPDDSTPIVNDYTSFATQIFELISNFNNYVHQHRHTVQDESF